MQGERPGFRRALAALEHRDFRLFYVALVAAGIGSEFQSTAALWQVFELTGSPLHLGLIGLARGLPILALSLMGGIVADRVDRRRFIMVTQALEGLLGVLLAMLTVSGLVQVWHIYAVILLSAALSAVNNPARGAITPNLVPQHHLLNAIALSSTVRQTGVIVGPALAGACIAVFGVGATYLANGAAQLVTLAALALMRLGRVPARPQQSPLRSFLEGLAFVRARSVILALLAMDCAATFFGHYRGLLPIFARELGVGAEGLGLLLAGPGVGALLGAAVVMSLGDVRYKGVITVGGILAYCGALVVLALSPWFLVALLATVALGAFDSLQATPRNAVIQAITPDELRGRVSGLHFMLAVGTPGLGQTQSGALASLVGAPVALIVGAAACASVVLGIAVGRRDVRAPDLGSTATTPRASA